MLAGVTPFFRVGVIDCLCVQMYGRIASMILRVLVTNLYVNHVFLCVARHHEAVDTSGMFLRVKGDDVENVNLG